MRLMGKNAFVSCLILLVLFGGVSSTSSASTTSPAKIFGGFLSNVTSKLMKWLWSLKATTKTAMSGRSMMKFERGYNLETVFDGSKLGIEPYWVEVLPNGELLILDSTNNNIYKISASLSLYSRPKLVAGSAEGYPGHVDGKHREARMNRPKGIAVDDRGNIYVADTQNFAIRKISDTGVTTIAGGKWGRGGAHADGPSEDSKFSDDFDVVYIGSSCSLLVIDRGNRAIREIQLRFDDCAYQYGSGFPIGFAVLIGAGFLGYLLALLQYKLVANWSFVTSQNVVILNAVCATVTLKGQIIFPMRHSNPIPSAAFELQGLVKTSNSTSPYKKQALKSVRPPLIPAEDEVEQQEEGFFGSVGKLLVNSGTSALDILEGVFPGLRKKALICQYPELQESFVILDEDEPPSIETRTPTPRKTYPFMSKDAEKMHQLRQSRAFYNGWDGDLPQQQQLKKQQQHSSVPHTYYEKTSGIVSGVVQEQDGKLDSVVIKPVNHEHPIFDHGNIRSRNNYIGHGRSF